MCEVRDVTRTPMPLRGWQRSLCDEFKLALLSLLNVRCKGKAYSEQVGCELVSACVVELANFGYDMDKITVYCDERNNTPERCGELWVEVCINFNNGGTFAILAFCHSASGIRAPGLVLR